MRITGILFIFLLIHHIGFCFTETSRPLPVTKKINLYFHHTIGNEPLVMGNSFINCLGEPLTIERFKYYVSNFSVTDDKGKNIALPIQYFLVDEADSLSKKITLTIPDISISRIHFVIGVDSIRNVSGIQTGALDPLQGMFWTWNSGYIMAKLEGTSPLAASPGQRFTYHIGGFRSGMNTIRTVSLTIDSTNTFLHEIHVVADINHWFKSTSEIKISETTVCHSPGPLATRFADNYRTMFSIQSIR